MHIFYSLDFIFLKVLRSCRMFLSTLLTLLLVLIAQFRSYIIKLYKRKNGSLYSISTRPIITVINYIY